MVFACACGGELVKIEWSRDNLVGLTATSEELSALVTAARLTRDAMLDGSAHEVVSLLERVLAEYDRVVP